MRTKSIVLLTGLIAACGSDRYWDEPTGQRVEAAWKPDPGAMGGISGFPSMCPDGTQGTAVTLQAGLTIPVGGTPDLYIDEVNPDVNTFGSTSCNVTGDAGAGKDRSCLLRWDVAYVIPVGKTVLDAWLQITIFDSSVQSYRVYFLSRVWDPFSATWNSAKHKSFWQVPGAKGAQDRSGIFTELPAGLAIGTHTVFANNVTAKIMVQEWVNDPKRNHGFIIANATNSDGLRIRTSASAVPENRPGLGIRYCP